MSKKPQKPQHNITWTWLNKKSPVGVPTKKNATTPDCVRIPVEIGFRSEWVSTPANIVPGPIHLAALPFKYTVEQNGQVFATNDPTADKEWYLQPTCLGTYLIGIDEQLTGVWTVEGNQIMIAPVDPNYYGQAFQISTD